MDELNAKKAKRLNVSLKVTESIPQCENPLASS